MGLNVEGHPSRVGWLRVGLECPVFELLRPNAGTLWEFLALERSLWRLM